MKTFIPSSDIPGEPDKLHGPFCAASSQVPQDRKPFDESMATSMFEAALALVHLVKERAQLVVNVVQTSDQML